MSNSSIEKLNLALERAGVCLINRQFAGFQVESACEVADESMID